MKDVYGQQIYTNFNVVFVDLDDFYDNAALFVWGGFVYWIFNDVLIVGGCSD